MMRQSFVLLVILIVWTSFAKANQSSDKPFAVVELFSSEGCSSCPPADHLVSLLTAWARKNNEPVYPLIFHVDYWNYLGWQDIYSRAEYSQRQTLYSQFFQNQGVYTPEMIVNGKDAFVGSNQEQLQKDLDIQLLIPAKVMLTINLSKQKNQVMVNYHVEGYSKGDVLNIALVERGLNSVVTAGENAGSTLHHDNLVRDFKILPILSASSGVLLPLDKISHINQASVIVYVQDPTNMYIEAAKQLDLG